MWSVHSTSESIGYAVESIQLAWRHLAAAVQHPDIDDRQAMCWAAHLAGKAINISRTTAPHAISYTITSQLGVPHGCAVALTLGAVLAFNCHVTGMDCNDSRGSDYVRQTIDNIVRLSLQTAIESVCPVVVRANECFRVAGRFVDDLRGSMQADVGKRSGTRIFIHYDQNGLIK